MNTACIQCRNLQVLHGQRRLILIPELSVSATGITVLTGPSGSGKSTFLRSLNRLNDCWQDLRTDGTVIVRLEGALWNVYPPEKENKGRSQGGEKHRGDKHRTVDETQASLLPVYPLEPLRRKIGMVMQKPLLFPMSIRENILLPLIHGAGKNKDEAQAAMRSALETAGLWEEVRDRLHAPAERLSGGQMQRLCLARALALEPEILLLDEPTVSLDPASTAHIEKHIVALAENLPIVLVTHDPAQAERLADRHLTMRNGMLQ